MEWSGRDGQGKGGTGLHRTFTLNRDPGGRPGVGWRDLPGLDV